MDDYAKIQSIIRSFREVHQALFLLNREQTAKVGITSLQYFALSVLARTPNLSLGELADILFTSNSTMSGVIDRLVKAEMVHRERSETDRRTLTMRLTALGEKKREEAHGLIMDGLSGLLEIPKEDVDQLLLLHQQVLSKLQLEGDGLKID